MAIYISGGGGILWENDREEMTSENCPGEVGLESRKYRGIDS